MLFSLIGSMPHPASFLKKIQLLLELRYLLQVKRDLIHLKTTKLIMHRLQCICERVFHFLSVAMYFSGLALSFTRKIAFL